MKSNIPMFLKPSQVNELIGINTKTLRDLKDTVFKKGVHYFIPDGMSYSLWKRDELINWIQGSNENNEVDSLVDDILNNK